MSYFPKSQFKKEKKARPTLLIRIYNHLYNFYPLKEWLEFFFYIIKNRSKGVPGWSWLITTFVHPFTKELWFEKCKKSEFCMR